MRRRAVAGDPAAHAAWAFVLWPVGAMLTFGAGRGFVAGLVGLAALYASTAAFQRLVASFPGGAARHVILGLAVLYCLSAVVLRFAVHGAPGLLAMSLLAFGTLRVLLGPAGGPVEPAATAARRAPMRIDQMIGGAGMAAGPTS